MKKKELIEIVSDQFTQIPENERQKHLHPAIIAQTFDTYYRYYISVAYGKNPDSISGCLDREQSVDVNDDGSGNLYSLPSKDVIPFFNHRGGVFDINKTGDTSLKFEGYSGRFESRNWNSLSLPYQHNIRYWTEEGNTDVETISDTIIWYEFSNSELTISDTVDLDLLITFVAHDDTQEVYVPKNIGGTAQLVDVVTRSMARKLGFNPEEILNQNKK